MSGPMNYSERSAAVWCLLIYLLVIAPSRCLSEMENGHVLFDRIVLYRQHVTVEGENRLFLSSHTVACSLRVKTAIIILKTSWHVTDRHVNYSLQPRQTIEEKYEATFIASMSLFNVAHFHCSGLKMIANITMFTTRRQVALSGRIWVELRQAFRLFWVVSWFFSLSPR